MGTMASQITSLPIVYLTAYSSVDQRKHQSAALLAFVWGIHWSSVNCPHKWPVTRKMFPFDDVIRFIFQWEYNILQQIHGHNEQAFMTIRRAKEIQKAGTIFWMCPANERRRYIITSSESHWQGAFRKIWTGTDFWALSLASWAFKFLWDTL